MGKAMNEEKITNIIKLKNTEFENEIKNNFNEFRKKRIASINEQTNIELERRVFLQTVDFLWRSHLQYLEHLRLAVSLRGYAQKDPLEEFKREAFRLFEGLLNKIKIDFMTFLNNLEIVTNTEMPKPKERVNQTSKISTDPRCLLKTKKDEKFSRNERCPVTGKKYKNCCGAL